MPELPEVECVRRSLERLVVGRRVRAVRVTRPQVIRGKTTPEALLVGDRVDRVLRQGKQLALVGQRGGCVCVHLGMSGQLCVSDNSPHHPALPKVKRTSGPIRSTHLSEFPAHTHVIWQFDSGLAMRFTDPRRFGGLWTFGRLDDLLTKRWAKLGPDALVITPAGLQERLLTTRRALKAALLDQQLVAGLGNIYVDELLYGARLHPLLPANRVDRPTAQTLVRRMRTLLTHAIERVGSSLRDYVDAENRQGSQQDHHRVYGRAGQPCKRRSCRGVIDSEQVAGRTTAWCPSCQGLDAPSQNV